MDIISAYQQLGSYRAAADGCGTTHKTVKRVMDKFEADQAGVPPQPRAEPGLNYDVVSELGAEGVEKSQGWISAKRLLPVARTAGYEGSPRNFPRLVADAKALWRSTNHSGRRPAVWSPGECLVIDWAQAAPELFLFLRGAGVLPLAVRTLCHRPESVNDAAVDRRSSGCDRLGPGPDAG